MRRDFALPEQDLDYLNVSGYNWDAVRDGNGMWLIIHSYPVPAGFNNPYVDVALKIEAGYPVAQIDMVYFSPALALLNNKQIRALSFQPIEGLNWQRWSRHRTGENPWRVGLDDISSHMQLVTYWMERELLQ
jgi:hypothetical protein